MTNYTNAFIRIAFVLGSFGIAIVHTACNDPGPSSSDQHHNTAHMDSLQQRIEANKALVRLWILDGWNNNRNAEVVDQVFAQDWVDGNPTFADQPAGIAGAMYFVDQYRKALPDIQFEITHLIADADYVTFRFEAAATHRGTLMGIPATGKRV